MFKVDINQGLIWACRLLLNREPESLQSLEVYKPYCQTAEGIRSFFTQSEEFSKRFMQAGIVRDEPNIPVDIQEGIIWAYRLYFQQEPTADQVDYHLLHVNTINDIRITFLLSREFEIRKGCGFPDLTDFEILNRFAPFCMTPAPEGFFNDFIGSKTRLKYLPPFFASKSGTVEGAPHTPTAGMHSSAEWIATLRSVIEAKGRLVAVELGAGWAPWLVTAAKAAERLGIRNIKLIGVEGSEEHVSFARQHFLDNGLDPDTHSLYHAVAGASDGIALFPKLLDPSEHYGANAVFGEDEIIDGHGLGEWEEIKSISIKTLISDIELIDILHVDIQGSETVVLSSGIQQLNLNTHRVVVGTHSRKIEAELLSLFSESGWILEFEKNCVISQNISGDFALIIDGEQIWRNPRLN